MPHSPCICSNEVKDSICREDLGGEVQRSLVCGCGNIDVCIDGSRCICAKSNHRQHLVDVGDRKISFDADISGIVGSTSIEGGIGTQ